MAKLAGVDAYGTRAQKLARIGWAVEQSASASAVDWERKTICLEEGLEEMDQLQAMDSLSARVFLAEKDETLIWKEQDQREERRKATS